MPSIQSSKHYCNCIHIFIASIAKTVDKSNMSFWTWTDHFYLMELKCSQNINWQIVISAFNHVKSKKWRFFRLRLLKTKSFSHDLDFNHFFSILIEFWPKNVLSSLFSCMFKMRHFYVNWHIQKRVCLNFSNWWCHNIFNWKHTSISNTPKSKFKRIMFQ